MKRSFALLGSLVTILLMAGCGGGLGSSSPAPTVVTVAPADTSGVATWNAQPGVEYWVWIAPLPNVTTSNCSQSAFCHTYVNVQSPLVMTGLTNGTSYSVTVNGRSGGGPGGPGSPSVSFVPRLAGFTWTVNPPIATSNLRGIAYAGVITVGGQAIVANTFVAVGAGGVAFTSADGATWSAQTTGVTANLNAITNGSFIFLAVGDSGTIITGFDGKTWGPQSSGTTNNLYAVSQNLGGAFVAVGAQGTILTSGDGATWATQTSGTSKDLYAITYANGIYVAVGAQGTLIKSPDAVTWTPVASNTSADLRGVTFNPGTALVPVNLFVAVGAAGTVITSPDGVTWTALAPISPNNLNAIVFGTQLVTIGDRGTIFVSPDSVNWTKASSGTTQNLNAITFTSLSSNILPGIGYAVVGTQGVNLTAF